MTDVMTEPALGSRTPPGAGLRRTAEEFVRRNPTEAIMLVALVGLWVVLAITAPFFLTGDNITNILQRATATGVVAVGMTFVIIGAGIDLSVGSIFGLSSTVGALAMVNHGVAVGVVVALLVGAGVGLLNGLLISYLRLAPFVVTLATLSLARSWDYLATGSSSVSGIPESFSFLGLDYIGPVPLFVVVLIVTFAVGQLMLSYSRFGRFLYAIGNNREAARLAGVAVRRYTVVPYVLSGLLAAVAALIALSRLLSVDPNAGTGLELDVIAAVVIGGTSLFGGSGSVVGTLIGSLFVASLANGLNLLDVSPFWQGSATGAVLLLAISLQSLMSGQNPLRRRRGGGRQDP